jgi:hypothetical protein
VVTWKEVGKGRGWGEASGWGWVVWTVVVVVVAVDEIDISFTSVGTGFRGSELVAHKQRKHQRYVPLQKSDIHRT